MCEILISPLTYCLYPNPVIDVQSSALFPPDMVPSIPNIPNMAAAAITVGTAQELGVSRDREVVLHIVQHVLSRGGGLVFFQL